MGRSFVVLVFSHTSILKERCDEQHVGGFVPVLAHIPPSGYGTAVTCRLYNTFCLSINQSVDVGYRLL